MFIGCGTGTSGTQPPKFSGNTSVTVLSSSTANGKVVSFGSTLHSLTLTSKSGGVVNLLPIHLSTEWTHVNGTAEPLATVSIPQGIYTSATMSLGTTGDTCIIVQSNGKPGTYSVAYLGTMPDGSATVNLPEPITVTGKSMGIMLDLLVSQSIGYAACPFASNPGTYPKPVFSLTPVTFFPQSKNNGRFNDLEGVINSNPTVNGSNGGTIRVASVEGSNYGGGDPTGAMDPANGPTWTIDYNSSTEFQGIADSSQLASGMPVDMDVAMQPDGSMLATRIAVSDADTSNLSLWNTPLITVRSAGPYVFSIPHMEIGPLLGGNGAPADLTSAKFAISGRFTNLASLPFPATFTAANMVAGQNVALTFHVPGGYPGGYGPAAKTATLLPQTINGTVSAVSISGNFSVYTVTLAPYDTFPTLAVQSNQTTVLTQPNTVMVYADAGTQKLNTAAVAPGSIMRFRGLVFNDNGTLRMDCSQVSDGVPE